MDRRTFVKTVGVGAAVLLVPFSASASQSIQVERVMRPVRAWLDAWGIEDQFEEFELRSYLEMGVDWANAQLEHEDGRQLAELGGDEIVTEMDGELLDTWLGVVRWHALAFATFALSFNWDQEGRLLVGRRDEILLLKDKAAAQCEVAIERFMTEADRRFEIATVE